MKTYILPWTITKGPFDKFVARKILLFGPGGRMLRDIAETIVVPFFIYTLALGNDF